MAHIGIFKRKNDGYKGTVRTLTLDREIDIIPAVASDAENAPDYRVLTGEVRSARAGSVPASGQAITLRS